MIYLVTDN